MVKTHINFLSKMVTMHGIIPSKWKSARTVLLPKPGKSDYTSPSSYRTIALLNTLSKTYEKLLTQILSQQVETNKILHRGHYGGRPNRLRQEATVHPVSWIKDQWAKGKVVGALFAEVKSAFPLVHHPCKERHQQRNPERHPQLSNQPRHKTHLQRVQIRSI